jgi:hypothetical protein
VTVSPHVCVSRFLELKHAEDQDNIAVGKVNPEASRFWGQKSGDL